MRNLEYPLSELYTYIPHSDKINKSISEVDVGWHIEHSLLVIIKIIETVCKSDPAQYKWKFNFIRTIVFFQNKFPRGKGKAPDSVIPKQIEKTDFETLFAATREAIERLKKAERNQFFLHPVFGNLSKKNTFIMLDIHTRHHTQIIKDIISSASVY